MQQFVHTLETTLIERTKIFILYKLNPSSKAEDSNVKSGTAFKSLSEKILCSVLKYQIANSEERNRITILASRSPGDGNVFMQRIGSWKTGNQLDLTETLMEKLSYNFY